MKESVILFKATVNRKEVLLNIDGHIFSKTSDNTEIL
jgi:hypothetical protein